ncbi:MAG: valine--tRNA ligase [Patescibacteria group bacterium]|nr:valine--tRNA ligase [Patescibacteria group bacterium]
MEPRYDIKEVEARIYKKWEDSGFFNPDVCVEKGVTAKDAEPFSIVLPPPNVTGELHMGHAAMLVIEDIMVRYERMRGKKTLWIPGTDHAAIATQSKVEKLIYKEEKKRRHDLGREEFLRRVNEFAAKSHDTIVKQVKRMGSSLDWSRETYTLDAAREVAVRTAFKKMYDRGLIYRGNRIVNWDPELGTTVSDDEIEWIEETVPLYYLKYGPFVIATARPETKFGDKYVVMHPDDKRYGKYKHGEKIELEWINGPVTATILKDSAIDMAFGTGVMTITPWHDMVDFDIALRHKLDMEQVIDLQGKLLPIAGEFAGQHIKKARPLIVEKLQSKGLIEKIDEKYTHRIATDSRGGGVIEPQILKQWFVAVEKKFNGTWGKGQEARTLKELMREAVESGRIKILPERFEKIYFHWIDNLRDWCISRQIWFGHRIPVWYKKKKDGEGRMENGEELYVGIEPPEGDGWEQDPDTLDTWFSSGLWPFSTLGWPDETPDLKTYFPNSVLETGYDILFFWVARMILMSAVLMDEVPFRKVYLHGLVRDEIGRKMSKSLGNGIDPLEMADKYGADATRLSLVIGASAGNDIKLSEDRIRGYRNFSTKIWNIARFIEMNKGEWRMENGEWNNPNFQLPTSDFQTYLDELNSLKTKITEHIENFEFHLAAEKLYHYIWHTLADKIIEAEKEKLRNGTEEEKQASFAILEHLLLESLKMLHPFMPFVTEEIYGIFKPSKMLMVEKW